MTNLNSWHSKHPRTSWKQKFWTLLAVVSNRHSIFDEFLASNMRNFRVLKSCFYSKANGEHTDIFLCRLVHPSEKKWNQWPMRYNFFRFSLGFEGRASLELELWTQRSWRVKAWIVNPGTEVFSPQSPRRYTN